jgi:predicted NBD/HSP70 family sugar kinase
VPTPDNRQTRVPPASAGNLLWLIRSGQARTRADVQTITGLSRSTVAARLESLIGAGYLRGSARDSSTGGRPPAVLEFDANTKVVLAADLGATHARLATMAVSGDVLATRSADLRIADGPNPVLDWVASQFQAMLAGIGRVPANVCGIGVGVPGPVDFDVGRVRKPPIMPGWDDYPITEHLQHLSPDGPVLVDNDANMMALGEQSVCYPDCRAFVLVKVATGIGAGVITDRAVYRGIDGGAGDIGHIRLHGYDDLRCMCGAYGCLAAVASGAALAHRLKAAGVAAESSRDLVRLMAAGDPDACRLAREAGQLVGHVLATVVCLLNPGVLVIAGDLAETHFVTGVREVLYQRALPRATQHLQVAIGQLGERAAILGAHAMVVEDVFSPAAVDARLEAAISR